MKAELIDVIIPFHKVNQDLIQAIHSVKQSLGVLTRIVAINDTGFDVSRDVLNLRPEDLLIPSEISGYVGAMATGVKFTTSKYVAFLDSDDVMHHSKLVDQVSEMVDNDRDLVTCKIVKFSRIPTEYVDFHVLGSVPVVLSQAEKLLFGAHGADSSILIKGQTLKSTWSLHAKYPPHLADYGWLLEIAQGLNVGHISDVRYFYRSHALQMSRTPNLAIEWGQIHALWVRNLVMALPSMAKVSKEINQDMSRAIAFPYSLPRLRVSERLKTIKILRIIRREIVRHHPNEGKQISKFINLRIVFLEVGTNPLHIFTNFKLIARIAIFLMRGKGIKRR